MDLKNLLNNEHIPLSSYSDAKCQVLANLANFAYDPINYGYIRNVGVLDIFLYVVKNETDTKLLHFAIAGICNLCIGNFFVLFGSAKCFLYLLRLSTYHH